MQEAFIALRKCEKRLKLMKNARPISNERFNDVMNVSHKVRERIKAFCTHEELKKEFSQLEKETDVKSLEMSVDKLKTEFFLMQNTFKKRIEKAKN